MLVVGNRTLHQINTALQTVENRITNWASYTLTITAVTSNPTKNGSPVTDAARFRQIGDSIEIQYNYRQTSAGTAGTGIYLFSLPNSYVIDTTKIAGSTSVDALGNVGICSAIISDHVYGYVKIYDSTHFALIVGNDMLSPASVSSTFFSLGNTTISYSCFLTLPIVGLSA